MVGLQEKKIILGVANIWSDLKGLAVFFELSKLIPVNYKIVLIGLNKSQIKLLPKNILGIERTENEEELVDLDDLTNIDVKSIVLSNYDDTESFRKFKEYAKKLNIKDTPIHIN